MPEITCWLVTCDLWLFWCAIIICSKLLSYFPPQPMHPLTYFFLLWPLITLCHYLGALSYLWHPLLSQKINNTADSYLDLTDLHSKWFILLFSDFKYAYFRTSNLDTTVFMSCDISMTRKCEYSFNIH